MNLVAPSVETVRNGIFSAIAEVRAVALAEGDKQRSHTADWLEELFADATNRRSLRKAAGTAFTLYRGYGSFSDAGSPDQHRVIHQLRLALRRARCWFLRNP